MHCTSLNALPPGSGYHSSDAILDGLTYLSQVQGFLYIQPEICRVVKEPCKAHCHFRADSTAFQQQLIDRPSGNAQRRCQFRNGQTGAPHKPFPQYGSGMGGVAGTRLFGHISGCMVIQAYS